MCSLTFPVCPTTQLFRVQIYLSRFSLDCSDHRGTTVNIDGNNLSVPPEQPVVICPPSRNQSESPRGKLQQSDRLR